MVWRVDSLAAVIWRLAVIFALAVPIGVAAPAQAATGRGSSGDNSALGPTVATNVLAKIYQSANARLATGDLEGAVAAFNLIVDVGPGLTEAQFSKALATVLLNFSARETTLSGIRSLAARDATNPLNQVLLVLADPEMSSLRSDGALYVTASGAARLRAASAGIENYSPARNGQYIAAFIASGQQTGDARYPIRYVGFSQMVGNNGTIRLPQTNEAIAFGRLFILSVDDRRFAPYESALIQRFQNGLKSLEQNRPFIARMEERIDHVEAALQTSDPTQRMVAISELDQLRIELRSFITAYDKTVGEMKIIGDNVDAKADVRIAGNQHAIQEQQERIAKLRRVARALDADTANKRVALSAIQKQYMDKVAKINQVQAKINETQSQLGTLQTRLSQVQGQLTTKEQTSSGLEQAMNQHTAEIERLRTREAALRQQQEAAANLDDLKRQKAVAASQLVEIRTQVKAAQDQRRGDLTSLQQQQADMNAKLSALAADVKIGEAARQRAEATKRELDQLLARKAALENGMATEEAKLAGVREERSKLQHEVVSIHEQQQRSAANQARLSEAIGDRDRLQQQLADIREQQKDGLAERQKLAARMREIDFGRYYALVIGNDEYEMWPTLHTAVHDARDVADLLTRKYGFKTRLLTNATKAQILDAINAYVGELGATDNLLIYYAGHGILERGIGYWVPVNAAMPSSGGSAETDTFVAHEELIHAMQKMHAKQVMVLADSCFSGGLAAMALAPGAETMAYRMSPNIQTRGLRIIDKDGDIPVETVQGTVARPTNMPPKEFDAINYWAGLPARVVLTSGGLEPVADQIKPGDRNSIFATAVLTTLRRNSGLLKSIELTNAVQEQVVRAAGRAIHRRGAGGEMHVQTPTYNNLMGYSGQFLFVARN